MNIAKSIRCKVKLTEQYVFLIPLSILKHSLNRFFPGLHGKITDSSRPMANNE